MAEEQSEDMDDQPEMDGFCRLPPEILQYVFSFLTWQQQLRVARVSQRWKCMVDILIFDRFAGYPNFIKPSNDEELFKMVFNHPTMMELAIDPSAEWGSLNLNIVASHFHNLRILDLEPFIIDQLSLERLCDGCPELEEVSLPSGCSESHLEVLLRGLPGLKGLDLSCTDVNGQCFPLLPRSLRKLDLSGCNSLESKSLKHLQRCPELEWLDVSGLTHLQVADLKIGLSECHELTALVAVGLSMSPDEFLPSSVKNNLRRLVVSNYATETEAHSRDLCRRLPGLQWLSVGMTPEADNRSLRPRDSFHDGEEHRRQSSTPSGTVGTQSRSSTCSQEPDEDYVTVGAIQYNRSKTIGEGSDGTRVYEGRFGRRKVAVKRILCDRLDAEYEGTILTEIDNHFNVVRFISMKKDLDFCWIVLELCLGSIEDYVKKRCNCPSFDDVIFLKNITEGLQWLHQKGIVHRDIKPTNILLAEAGGKIVPKIADFGICKRLPSGRVQVTMTHSAGTKGWMAPEIAPRKKEPVKGTAAVDVFSSGCVFYYMLSRGEHPFGDDIEQQTNIRDAKLIWSAGLDYTSECLIKKMIDQHPEERPSASDVLGHPLFWTPEKKMRFIQEVSNREELDKKLPNDENALANRLEKGASTVIGGTEESLGNWKEKIDHSILKGFSKKGYNGSSIVSLMRVMRNKLSHKRGVEEMLGQTSETHAKYWTTKFPRLEMHVWRAVSEFKEDDIFKEFYKSDG